MADITKTTNEVKLIAAFADEDDRTLTINNPRAGITASDIRQLEETAANVLIGDKYSAEFTRFKKATYITKAITTLDMTL